MRQRFPTLLLCITLCVVVGHAVLLNWATGIQPVALQDMPEPLFGRVLTPQQPTAATSLATPPPAKRYATWSTALTAHRPVQESALGLSESALAPETVQSLERMAPVPEAAPVQASPAGGDQWPPDTRVTYVLKGYFRGDFYGDAKVQWQRKGEVYQVQVDINLPLFIQMTLTSQGRVTPEALEPDIYQEVRPGRREQLTTYGTEARLNNGQLVSKPDGMQDTASQFVALAQRFAMRPEQLKVGGEVSLWLGRPNGVDLWTYDIVAEDTLETPKLGRVQAFHLKPRPLARPRGPVMAELWFAPSLQYLPVRVLLTQGDDTFVDLLVEKISQGDPSLPPSGVAP